MARILIIDDDPGISHLLGRITHKQGHQALHAGTMAQSLDLLQEGGIDCVFLDVRLPDGDGLTLIPDIKALPDAPEVIILTGHGDPDGAETAITSGAWSYLEKTASLDQLTLALDQAVKYRQRRVQARARVLRREGLVGDSMAMNRVLDGVAQAASSRANVLLMGETGTGKELVARAIHANGGRASGPFVTVDCAALPTDLVESTLFGHVKGAFTGAESSRDGLVKLADGGDLFLDEVGELPPPIQKAFLRVLQERRFRPLGSRNELTSDFRLIAATNRDLGAMSQDGSFRPDLLYRLKTLTVRIPPLRERLDDLEELARHHMTRLCHSYGLPLKDLSPEVLGVFRGYDWPGNIRELVNVLERTLINAYESAELYLEHLPLELRARAARQSVGTRDGSETPEAHPDARFDEKSAMLPAFKAHRQAAVSVADKAYLLKLMELSGGSIKRACEIAELSRTRLYCLMKEHGITKRLD